MAVQHRHGSYRVIFRYHGKQHSFTLGEVSSEEAGAKAAHVDYLLMRLKQRLATVPQGIGIVEYVQFDGKPPSHDTAETPPAKTTLGSFATVIWRSSTGCGKPSRSCSWESSTSQSSRRDCGAWCRR
jgi:hypothetical protein